MSGASRRFLSGCAVPASAFALGAGAHAVAQPQRAGAAVSAARPAIAFSIKDRSGRSYVDGTGQDIGQGRFRIVARLQRLIVDGAYVLRIELFASGGRGAGSLVYDLTAKGR